MLAYEHDVATAAHVAAVICTRHARDQAHEVSTTLQQAVSVELSEFQREEEGMRRHEVGRRTC